ncbi:HhH-GPD domain-containing protein [Pleurotus pulmonarius]
MSPPRTPKRRRPKDNESLTVSPYFWKIHSSPDISPYRFSAILHYDDHLKPTPRSTLRDLAEDEDHDHSGEDDENLVEDPLFLFHFRISLDLYQRLYATKPNMIQEIVAEDPWKVLVAVTLLNKTAGKLAIPVFHTIMKLWPTPWALSQAPHSVLEDLLHPLGCYVIRANRLTCLSSAYLLDPPCVTDLRPTNILITAPNSHLHSPGTERSRYPPTPISHLPGTGPYALDSYRIFCIPESDEWKRVMPSDKELVRFLRWKWAMHERMLWLPDIGVVRQIRDEDLRELIDDLVRTTL